MHRSELTIPTPCHEDWEAMSGSDRRRHCEACGTRVTDLSALSAWRARLSLAVRSNGCFRYTTDANGQVRARRSRIVAAVAAMAAWLPLPAMGDPAPERAAPPPAEIRNPTFPTTTVELFLLDTVTGLEVPHVPVVIELDSAESPVPEALHRVERITGPDGRLSLELPPGRWRMEVMKPGFRGVMLADIVTGARPHMELTIQLRPASEQGSVTMGQVLYTPTRRRFPRFLSPRE